MPARRLSMMTPFKQPQQSGSPKSEWKSATVWASLTVCDFSA
jgi:hypothetical protein